MNVSEEAMSMFVCGGGVEKKKKIITKLTYDVNKSWPSRSRDEILRRVAA